MQAVQKDLMDMLVRELKEELEARDQPKTGNKAWLRRRLHGATVHLFWTLLSRARTPVATRKPNVTVTENVIAWNK